MPYFVNPNQYQMETVKKNRELQEKLKAIGKKGNTIGFVPTMGALHRGHMALVERSLDENDTTVVSIYVNPTQFNEERDLKNYPRDLEKDARLLDNLGTDILFAPRDKEIYPDGFHNDHYDFGHLDKVLEGAHRPGHFDGVATVVGRLFDRVGPDRAYFGEKDYQQLQIVRQLVAKSNHHIKVVACPIVREEDGLAMSSRNQLLSPAERKFAPFVYQSLQNAKNLSKSHPLDRVRTWVKEQFYDNPALKLEYFEIVNARSLNKAIEKEEPGGLRACIAVWAGPVRLIDNMDFSS
jgi:pantoate--beta-alanine ligase